VVSEIEPALASAADNSCPQTGEGGGVDSESSSHQTGTDPGPSSSVTGTSSVETGPSGGQGEITPGADGAWHTHSLSGEAPSPPTACHDHAAHKSLDLQSDSDSQCYGDSLQYDNSQHCSLHSDPVGEGETSSECDRTLGNSAQQESPGAGEWGEGSQWYDNPGFRRYWLHYNQVMTWCRKHSMARAAVERGRVERGHAGRGHPGRGHSGRGRASRGASCHEHSCPHWSTPYHTDTRHCGYICRHTPTGGSPLQPVTRGRSISPWQHGSRANSSSPQTPAGRRKKKSKGTSVFNTDMPIANYTYFPWTIFVT
jgi:hypothetical protein